MKRFLFTIVLLMFLATTALAADYSSDSGIDGWYDVSSSLTTTTRIPAQDSSDTDVLGYITPEDIFGLMDDTTFGASSDTSKVWTWDVGASPNPYLTIDQDYFTFSKPVKAPGFVSNADDGEHYLDVGNTNGFSSPTLTPSAGWLNYDATSGEFDFYDGSDWDQYLIRSNDTSFTAKLDRYHQTAHFDPDNQYANYDGVVVLDTYTAAAITVSAVRVYLNEAPTNEVSFTVYQEAAAVGYASGTVIGSGTTSSGIATVTSFTDNTVPAGSKIWVDVTSDPDSTTTGFEIVVEGTYD